MNGVIDLDESSDSDGDVASELRSSQSCAKSENIRNLGLIKEDTAEKKIILDGDGMTMNSDAGDCDTNLFSSDPNGKFRFSFESRLSESVLCGDSVTDASDKEPARKLNIDDPSSGNQISELENGVTSIEEVEDQHEEDENMNEDASEQVENRDNSLNDELRKCDGSVLTTGDYNENEDKIRRKIEGNEDGESATSRDNEDNGKDGNNREGGDHETTEKRPSSRESTTSTTSSSSERITIRSTSQLNQLVSSNSDVKIKTEKEATTDRPADKPGLSVLNPSQLGASENISGENLLQSGSFVAPADQLISFLPSGMPPMTQCDVCETQCADGASLDEHRAVAGHYKCRFGTECATFVFSTQTELSAHQQTVHGLVNPSPVQQLTHQVQSIPMRYLDQPPVANNYQTGSAFATSNQPNRGIVPQILSQNNVSIRQYGVGGAPRIGGVRSMAAQQQSSNSMKRVGPPLQQPALRQLTPSKRRCVDSFSNRNGDTDCKFVSVQKPDNTDDVVAQLSKSITITARQETQKKNDTVAVTHMLANRGITVSSVPTKANKNNPVAMLNLNSAVSLIPTNANSGHNRQSSGFAVPQSRVGGNRQSLPGPVSQTVDLTGPDTPRVRPAVNRAANRFTCRICDRPFLNQEQLNQHMTIHRSGPKKQLPYKCPNCAAQYPNQQALTQHRQICRRDTVSSTNEMVIPIVDLKHPGALQRLQSMGINHMIPLNALGSQAANGTFGIPILAFSSDRVTNTNMANIGISNILPVGPLRRLSHL